MMSSEQSIGRSCDDFSIIWLDEHHSDVKHSINTRFGRAAHDIQTFDDITACVKYIRDVEKQNIFLIIHERLIHEFLLQLHGLPRIYSIYILSSHTNLPDDETTILHEKVRGTFSDILSLFEQLTQDIRVAEESTTPISMLEPNLSSCKGLATLDHSFVCSHLFKDLILETIDDDESQQQQQQFVEFCRKQYAKNQAELKIIKEFAEHYHNHSPIWWYTRECFLHKMLNKAFRIQDIEVLLKMRFFIRAMHQQIEQIHSSKSSTISRVLYRGQGLLTEELEILKRNLNGILSFNSFLLTNSSHEISLHFAQHSFNKTNIVPVVFEIHLNSSMKSTCFAPLNGTGYFPTETDILFSIHAMFRIQAIRCKENHIWNIELATISDNDSDLRWLNDTIRTEIQGYGAMHRLGTLMLQVHEYDIAKDIFEYALRYSTTDNKHELAYIEDCLGKIYDGTNDSNTSLKHYQKALDIKLTYLTANDSKLIPTYIDLGCQYQKLRQFDLAMQQYQCALDLGHTLPMADQGQKAKCYMNIGDLLCQLKQYEKAREHFNHALTILLKLLPLTYSDIVKARNHLYNVCLAMDDYHGALEQAKALLRIAQKSNPPNQAQMAVAHNNMSLTLDKLEKYKESLEEAEKAMKIAKNIYPHDHSSLKDIEEQLEMMRWKNAQL